MDLPLHLATIVVVLLVTRWLLLWRGISSRSDRIPSAPGELPFLGHVLQLMKSPKFMLEHWAWQYDSDAYETERNGSDVLARSHNAFSSVGITKFVENLEGADKRIVSLKLRERFRRDLEVAEINQKNDPLAFEKNQMDLLRILKECSFDAMMVLALDVSEDEYIPLVDLDDMERFTDAVIARIGAPFPYWKYFKTKADREVDNSVKRITTFARFVSSRIKKNDSNQEKVEHDMLVDNTLMILFAGYDTIAKTLFHLIHWLATMPHVQEKVQKEPERWFELYTNDELRKKELAHYLPFSWGSHVCPGRHLAMAEMVYVVAILMAEFSFSLKSVPWHVPNLAKTTFDHTSVRVVIWQWLKWYDFRSHVCPGRHLAMAEMVYVVAILMAEFSFSLKSVPWHVPNLAKTTFDHTSVRVVIWQWLKWCTSLQS
ncbi:cytochrome P450 [Cladochytrium replicatum]|nr:cytochrome P450 [Cladochytrium replicatum]